LTAYGQTSNLGRVIISMDFEIGWGDVTNGRWREHESNGVYKRLRVVLRDMLAALDAHEIAFTWATVGAMFDECQRTLDHLPPLAASLVSDALGSARREDTFNGKDLFELVLGSKTEQAIACHSYSHVPFTFEGVDSAFVSADLAAFESAIGKYNRRCDRLVFPENKEAHQKAVASAGYTRVRVSPVQRFNNRYLYLLSTPFLAPPMARDEQHTSGLERHAGSMLFADVGQPARIPVLKRRVELGLRDVVKKGHTLHIWAHPFNFSQSEPLYDALVWLLNRIARERDEGRLLVETM